MPLQSGLEKPFFGFYFTLKFLNQFFKNGSEGTKYVKKKFTTKIFSVRERNILLLKHRSYGTHSKNNHLTHSVPYGTFLDKKYCNFKTWKIIERERSERQFHKKNYLETI